MRNVITIINLAILFGITSIFSRTENNENDRKTEPGESVEAVDASKQIETIQSNFTVWPTQWSGDDADVTEPDADVSEGSVAFIQEMSDPAIVNLETVKLATQRATKRPLKDYATSVAKDQSTMLDELTGLAKKKKIKLKSLSTSDTESRLKQYHGASFDKRFVSMMLKDHKKNLKKLQKATHSKDADIQVFATKYLPVVQSNLDKIKSIKNAR